MSQPWPCAKLDLLTLLVCVRLWFADYVAPVVLLKTAAVIVLQAVVPGLPYAEVVMASGMTSGFSPHMFGQKHESDFIGDAMAAADASDGRPGDRAGNSSTRGEQAAPATLPSHW